MAGALQSRYDAEKAVCDALGLHANNVLRLDIRFDSKEGPSVVATICPPHEQLHKIAAIVKTMAFITTEIREIPREEAPSDHEEHEALLSGEPTEHP